MLEFSHSATERLEERALTCADARELLSKPDRVSVSLAHRSVGLLSKLYRTPAGEQRILLAVVRLAGMTPVEVLNVLESRNIDKYL